MLQRNLSDGRAADSVVWDDLSNGIPTISALANLCSRAMGQLEPTGADTATLPDEAFAILKVAAETGSISIRGDKNAFEPGERYLAICVEQNEGQRIEFRAQNNPEQTIRFVDAFRQLCCGGLVMHQLMNEFSLTASGFEMAQQVDEQRVQSLIAVGREIV